MKNLLKLDGFEISFHEKSKRIINIKIEDQIIDRLVFPFKKFNITALEYKPFTRFTIAKSLDETASNKLSNFLNEIIKDRDTGCFIIGPKNKSSKIFCISNVCNFFLVNFNNTFFPSYIIKQI